MKWLLKSCLCFVFLAPIAVQVDPERRDSSVTNLEIAGGVGTYAYITRGCEGQVLEKHKIPFEDFGAGIDHKFYGTPLRLGVRYFEAHEKDLGQNIDFSKGNFIHSWIWNSGT